MLSSEILTFGMEAALAEARLAAQRAEVPVGAIVLQLPAKEAGGEGEPLIVGRGSNQVEELSDASAHAEMVAMRAAAKQLGRWRLNDCALFVTLEPCSMCAGALRNFRLAALVFGASDPRMGAVGSLFDLTLDSRLGPVPKVIAGVQQKQCAAELSQFFKSLRAEKSDI